MKSNSFARNLQFGAGLSLFLLLLSSAASFISISRLLDSSKWVTHTHQAIQKIDNIGTTIREAEVGQRGYLLTGRQRFLDPYLTSYQRIKGQTDSLGSFTADNRNQAVNLTVLRDLIAKRFARLQLNVDRKRGGRMITPDDIELGNDYSEQLRVHLKKMVDEEERLLRERTGIQDQFATYTPILIVIASLLSLGVSIFFFRRVLRDFRDRTRLARELEEKDADIRRRIDIIQTIAGKISAGDYGIRLNEEEKDGLGSLSLSLNKMSESLGYSFGRLSDKEWLQTGVTRLNDVMTGEKDLETLSRDIVREVAAYSESQVGALYLAEATSLRLTGTYAFTDAGSRTHITFGDGLAGECALTGKQVLIKDIPPDSLVVKVLAGDIRPQHSIAFPLFRDSVLKGVIEIASVEPFSANVIDYFSAVSHNAAIALNTAQNRRRLQELLEETQAQSEELQMQHSELENLNSELEGNTQKLQASEEELRVQQEELLQTNRELEERSRLLEEKNQVIVERNLDIQQKADELEQSTRYKSEFLANMSHELRTPLNSILLLSRMMSDNPAKNLDDEQVEAANVIQNSGKSLLSLIDEILDLSKIEAGKMELEYSVVELDEIVQDMRSLFTPIAREKGLELGFTVAKSIDRTLTTDKLRLEQILKNLLSNALKFTAKGGVSLDITTGNKGMMRFSVKDTGLGIPEDKQGLIFEAFKQADGSTRRKYGGTGLGLSISRELAKLLGGEITLKSTPEKGSEFTVTVPVDRPLAGTASEADREISGEPAPALPPALESPGQRRFISAGIPEDVPDDRGDITAGDKVVLIVEDDTGFARALLDFTHKRKYKGVVSVRGDLALQLAETYKPVAILLDIQLPVKDGWQVMEELKNNPKTRHIPVHIMSSMEVKKESLVKGAVDFINKPVALEQMTLMFAKLEDALNRSPKKVLIVEENPKHAKALGYFLESFSINSEIRGSISEGVSALQKKEVDCVILDMGIPDQNAYETLETVKKSPGLEDLPIIIFTGKNLSKAEEQKIMRYADSIVVKTAHSYQRILDEIALFLHLVEENITPGKNKTKNLSGMNDVLPGKKVLVADDDVRNIYSLTRALEQHKITVLSATDGREALRILDENPDTDLVLMDMMMPEMDGYESTRQIRQNARYRNLPVLAVTAKAMLGDREKCIEAGASDYISKPVDIDQLISLLRVWLYDRSV